MSGVCQTKTEQKCPTMAKLKMASTADLRCIFTVNFSQLGCHSKTSAITIEK